MSDYSVIGGRDARGVPELAGGSAAEAGAGPEAQVAPRRLWSRVLIVAANCAALAFLARKLGEESHRVDDVAPPRGLEVPMPHGVDDTADLRGLEAPFHTVDGGSVQVAGAGRAPQEGLIINVGDDRGGSAGAGGGSLPPPLLRPSAPPPQPPNVSDDRGGTASAHGARAIRSEGGNGAPREGASDAPSPSGLPPRPVPRARHGHGGAAPGHAGGPEQRPRHGAAGAAGAADAVASADADADGAADAASSSPRPAPGVRPRARHGHGGAAPGHADGPGQRSRHGHGVGGATAAAAAAADGAADAAASDVSHGRGGAAAEAGKEKHNRTLAEKIKAAEDITDRGNWTLVPSRNCFYRHGSGRFPDGTTGDCNGSHIDLDECLALCQETDFCDGVVVETGRLNGPCSLRTEVSFSSCQEDVAFDAWMRVNTTGGRVAKLRERVGWRLHERKNCFPGQGSAEVEGTDALPSPAEPLALDECLLACQEMPLCEGVAVSHGEEVTACSLRAWVEVAECADHEGFDLWVLDQTARRTSGPEPPAGVVGRDRLVGAVDMIRQDDLLGRIDLTSCALVGASGALSGAGLGASIDAHTAVIRLDRMPTEEFYGDFGSRTDFLFLSKARDGAVELMGGEVSGCHDVEGCDGASVIVRADLDSCDPGHLAYTWGKSHPIVGCQHRNISRMVAMGFSTLEGFLPTTGAQAFFTFLPLCDKLDLFGFGDRSTGDGLSEWPGGHNPHEEHLIQDMIVAGQWLLPWRSEFGEAKWLRKHAARVRKVTGAVA